MDNDEWFFNSFKRYHELQMFDFPKPAKEIDITSINSLCVALEKDITNRNEILIFSLPTTLQTKSKNTGLKIDRHLSFDHGYFTESPLVQMKCIANEEKLIISEKNGLALFDMSCKESDLIKKISDIPTLVNDTLIAVNCINNLIVLCGSENKKEIVNYDSLTTTMLIEEKDKNYLKVPLFSSSNTVSFGNTFYGNVSSYDIRTGNSVGFIIIPNTIQASNTVSHWIFNSTFEFRPEYSSESNLLYLFSTNGDFLIYDSRNFSQPIQYLKYPIAYENITGAVSDIKINVCPDDFNKFTVCGFDENVYVYESKNNKVSVIFTHDGHPYSDNDFEYGVKTVCSLWLPFISSNTVVSCGSNSSVQCWQYAL